MFTSCFPQKKKKNVTPEFNTILKEQKENMLRTTQSKCLNENCVYVLLPNSNLVCYMVIFFNVAISKSNLPK